MAFRQSLKALQATPHPQYPGHVHLNAFDKPLLAVGSALASLINPHRHDMIAALGETTSDLILPKLRSQMLSSPEGRSLLKHRPRISSQTINIPALQQLPPNTFGKHYADWLHNNSVTPDTRSPVRFIDDPELAYILQRYRESHDLYHVILGPFPVNISGEIIVKWFELANLGLPLAGLSAVFGPLRLKSQKRRRLLQTYVPWALRCGANAVPMIGVQWEKHWEMDMEELRRKLKVEAPPINWDEFRAQVQR